MDYSSTADFESQTCPGVTFTIRRMSFERRLELIRRVRDAARELEFRTAGESMDDQLAGAAIHAAVEGLYIRWGLHRLHGLRIDGADADTDALLSRGPEVLCREIASEVRRECGLTDEERKN